MAAPNPERQRAARDKLKDLSAYPASVLIIHYACQNFNQRQRQGSPRITAITVRNVGSGETWVFSIYREAELARLGPVQILSRIDELEHALLEKFFQFININRNNRFVHWNMRDATFGFAAIEHRFRVLGGQPVCIADTNKFDLARAFADIYGSRYVKAPYLKGLAERNKLSQAGYLNGPEEAEAFETGAYDLVQRSVLSKVDIMFKVFHLAFDRTLKTEANWWTLNRGRAREAWEMLEHNPIYAVGALVATAFGIALKFLEYTGL